MSLLYPQCSIGGGKGEGQFEKEMAMNMKEDSWSLRISRMICMTIGVFLK